MIPHARFPNRALIACGLALVAGIAVLSGQQNWPPQTADPRAGVAVNATPGPDASVLNLRITSGASPDLTDLDSLVHSTTSQWPTAAEKVRSLFHWTHVLRRQTTPMVLHGLEVTDPIQNFVDYGFTMCSTTSGINQSLYEQLGLRHQYWDICNHTRFPAGGGGGRGATGQGTQPALDQSVWLSDRVRHLPAPPRRHQLHRAGHQGICLELLRNRPEIPELFLQLEQGPPLRPQPEGERVLRPDLSPSFVRQPVAARILGGKREHRLA
jgi:hypothetical protein